MNSNERLRLESEVVRSRLSTYSSGVIMNPNASIWYNISHKHRALHEEADEIIGGKISIPSALNGVVKTSRECPMERADKLQRCEHEWR